MKKRYNIDLSQELVIEFSDPEKAEKYFVGENSEHAQAFFESEDMEDFVRTFSLMFANHLNSVSFSSVLYIEGFAPFKRKDGEYISSTDEYGDITIHDVWGGLEVDYIS